MKKSDDWPRVTSKLTWWSVVVLIQLFRAHFAVLDQPARYSTPARKAITQLTMLRRVAVKALLCYLVFLAWVLFWTSGGPASTSVDHALQFFWGLGFPHSLVTGGRVEFALNALMIAPVPLLALLAGARWAWERWTAYGFVGSSTVELVQGVFLAGRSAQFQDVVANTAGMFIGAVLGLMLLRFGSRRSD